MSKKANSNIVEFEQKARQVISIAFLICEEELKNGKNKTQKKALSSATLSLEKSIDVFLNIQKLCD